MLKAAAKARNHAWADCPEGFNVPGLDVLLTPSAMLETINGLLPATQPPFRECSLVNLRYKTPTSCLVTYQLARPGEDGSGNSTTLVYARGFSRPQYEIARPKIATTRWVNSADGPSVSLLPDMAAILYWFPNDERLHGLRRITVSKKLQRLFYRHLAGYPPDQWRISDRSIRLQVVRYKPERRAVIRCRFRAHRHADGLRQERFVYIGVYEEGRDRYLWNMLRVLHQESAGSGWSVPKPLAWIAEHGALASDMLGGTPLQDILSSGAGAGDTELTIQMVATALARLHAVSPRSVPVSNADHALQRVNDTRDMLSRFAPTLGKEAGIIAKTLGESLRRCNKPIESLVHGDLHPKQIIVSADTIGFLDFDRAQIGECTMDLGNFRAQLWLNGDGQPQMDPETIARTFLEQYQEARGIRIPRETYDLWTAVALFHSALRPIGRMQKGWRSLVQSILNHAGTLVE